MPVNCLILHAAQTGCSDANGRDQGFATIYANKHVQDSASNRSRKRINSAASLRTNKHIQHPAHTRRRTTATNEHIQGSADTLWTSRDRRIPYKGKHAC